MKKLLTLSAGPLYLLFLAGFTCTQHSEQDATWKAFFWKKTDSAGTHYLYVDNIESGVVPFISEKSTPADNNIVQKQGLFMKMRPGRHDIQAKDKSGNVLCTGTLFLKKTDGSEEIKSSWKSNDCSVLMVND